MYSLLFDKLLALLEPVHVEALVLVKRHALNKGRQMFVNAVSFEVLGQRGLNAFFEGGEVGARILTHLSLETVNLAICGDVIAHLNRIIVDFSVHGGGLDDHAALLTFLLNVNSEVAVVLRLTLFFFLVVLFLVGVLLAIRDRLSNENS